MSFVGIRKIVSGDERTFSKKVKLNGDKKLIRF